MKPRCSPFLCLTALLLALLVSPRAEGETRWTEVRSPHFRVITDGSGADGGRVANQFELIRYVISYRFPSLRLDGDSPVLIVAAVDQSSAERLEPELAKLHGRIVGNFFETWPRSYVMVRLDQWDQGAQEAVFHEYTESILHLNTRWLPRWLEVGMADFFGSTRVAEGKVYVGAPTLRSRTLNDGRLLPLGMILSMKSGDYIRDERRTQQFYVEAWGLVHYLTFGPGMGDGAKLALYFSKIQMAGVNAQTVFREIFGDPAGMDPAFQAYVGKFLLTAAVIPLPSNADTKSYDERILPTAEADYLLGAFHAGIGDVATGRALLEKAIQRDPKLGGPHAEMGFLLYGEGKDEEARTEWTQAVALDPKLYLARFAEIMTGKPFWEQTSVEQVETLKALRGVVHVNPSFAAGYMEIALLDWRMGDLDGALRASREGEQLEPWRAGYRVVTGRILLAQGKDVEAANVARAVAAQWPGTDGNEATELWDEVPAGARGDGEPLKPDLGPGVELVRGAAESLQCGDPTPGARMKLQLAVHPEGSPEGTLVRLTAGDHMHYGFMDTLWRGERHFDPCRHVVNQRVVAAYRPTGTGMGELVWFDVTERFPYSKATPKAVADATVSQPSASAP